jgi:hypothetical protein
VGGEFRTSKYSHESSDGTKPSDVGRQPSEEITQHFVSTNERGRQRKTVERVFRPDGEHRVGGVGSSVQDRFELLECGGPDALMPITQEQVTKIAAFDGTIE